MGAWYLDHRSGARYTAHTRLPYAWPLALSLLVLLLGALSASAADLLAEARRAEREGRPADEYAACGELLRVGPSEPCTLRLAFLEPRRDPDGSFEGLQRLTAAQRGEVDRVVVERLLADPSTPPALQSDAQRWLDAPKRPVTSRLPFLGWTFTGVHVAIGFFCGRSSRGWWPGGLLPLGLIGGVGLLISAAFEPSTLGWMPGLLGRLLLVHLAAAAGAAPLRNASRQRQALWSALSALGTLGAALPALVQVGWL